MFLSLFTAFEKHHRLEGPNSIDSYLVFYTLTKSNLTFFPITKFEKSFG